MSPLVGSWISDLWVISEMMRMMRGFRRWGNVIGCETSLRERNIERKVFEGLEHRIELIDTHVLSPWLCRMGRPSELSMQRLVEEGRTEEYVCRLRSGEEALERIWTAYRRRLLKHRALSLPVIDALALRIKPKDRSRKTL